MLKRNSLFKILLIILSLLTIISLVYLKLIIVNSPDQINYFPFYKSMTFVEYGETTIPGFFEMIAFIGISIAYIFLAISGFSKNNRQIFLLLAIFEGLLLAILITNLITFQIIHKDLQLIPGPTLFLLLIMTVSGIVYGYPRSKKIDTADEKTAFVDPDNIRPISEILKEKRQAAHVTQQQLAESIEVSRNTVYRWESGESNPNMDYMLRVANELKFPVSDFWGNDDESLNQQIGDVVKQRQLYRQALYFVLSIILVIVAVFSVAYLGRNFNSPSLDRINPFLKQEVGYVMVQKHGQQKAAVIDNDYAAGSIITINGTYTNKTEFIKVIHKGAYVKYEVRNVKRNQVPTAVRNNLYQVSHFRSPEIGLKELQQSYTKRYI